MEQAQRWNITQDDVWYRGALQGVENLAAVFLSNVIFLNKGE